MSEHHHDDHDHSELSETELRVRALETILTEKGYVDPKALDLLIEAYETKIGPRNGARIVAKAWSDPGYKAWLLADATPAIASPGIAERRDGRRGVGEEPRSVARIGPRLGDDARAVARTDLRLVGL